MRPPLALYAYPRGPRRDEVLDTLLMAGAPGGPRQSLNLLRHGLRARLGRPRSRGVVALAVAAALVAGFFTASLANWLTWQAVPGLPGPAQRAQLAELIAPGLPVAWHDWEPDDPSRAAAPFASLGGELTPRHFSAYVDGTPETRQVQTYVSGLRDRLAAAGWRVLSESPADVDSETGEVFSDSTEVVARDDHLILTFVDQHDDVEPQSMLSLTVRRAEPPWVTTATILGLLAGALIGWLVTGWASRRTEGARATRLAGTPAVAALVLLVPQAAIGYLLLAFQAAAGGPPGAPFWTFSVTYFFGLARIGLLGLGISLLAAALARPAEHPAVAA